MVLVLHQQAIDTTTAGRMCAAVGGADDRAAVSEIRSAIVNEDL